MGGDTVWDGRETPGPRSGGFVFLARADTINGRNEARRAASTYSRPGHSNAAGVSTKPPTPTHEFQSDDRECERADDTRAGPEIEGRNTAAQRRRK